MIALIRAQMFRPYTRPQQRDNKKAPDSVTLLYVELGNMASSHDGQG